jgi:hypothetical protein
MGHATLEKITSPVSIPANNQTVRLFLTSLLLFAAETTKAPVTPTPLGL